MNLTLIFFLIISCLSVIKSHPKNSGILPKEYYKRQILQPLPGYIPVYLKADGVDVIRKKASLNENKQSAEISTSNVKGKPNHDDGKILGTTDNASDSGIKTRKIDLLKAKENVERNSNVKLTKV